METGFIKCVHGFRFILGIRESWLSQPPKLGPSSSKYSSGEEQRNGLGLLFPPETTEKRRKGLLQGIKPFEKEAFWGSMLVWDRVGLKVTLNPTP